MKQPDGQICGKPYVFVEPKGEIPAIKFGTLDDWTCKYIPPIHFHPNPDAYGSIGRINKWPRFFKRFVWCAICGFYYGWYWAWFERSYRRNSPVCRCDYLSLGIEPPVDLPWGLNEKPTENEEPSHK